MGSKNELLALFAVMSSWGLIHLALGAPALWIGYFSAAMDVLVRRGIGLVSSTSSIIPGPRDPSRVRGAGPVVTDPDTGDEKIEDEKRTSFERRLERTKEILRGVAQKRDQGRDAQQEELRAGRPGGHV